MDRTAVVHKVGRVLGCLAGILVIGGAIWWAYLASLPGVPRTTYQGILENVQFVPGTPPIVAFLFKDGYGVALPVGDLQTRDWMRGRAHQLAEAQVGWCLRRHPRYWLLIVKPLQPQAAEAANTLQRAPVGKASAPARPAVK